MAFLPNSELLCAAHSYAELIASGMPRPATPNTLLYPIFSVAAEAMNGKGDSRYAVPETEAAAASWVYADSAGSAFLPLRVLRRGKTRVSPDNFMSLPALEIPRKRSETGAPIGRVSETAGRRGILGI